MLNVLLCVAAFVAVGANPEPVDMAQSVEVLGNPRSAESVSTSGGKVYADGVVAILGHMRHVTPAYAADIVRAATAVVSKPKYSWLTVPLLVGLASNESDLRPGLRVGYDCGITQVRATSQRVGAKAARRLCQQVVESADAAFAETARILTSIRDRYCKYWWRKARQDSRYEARFRRCVLNVYNQGPWYYRREKCGDDGRCKIKAGYWNRVTCFAVGVAGGRRSRWSCRRAWSDRWVRRAYKIRRLPRLFVFHREKEVADADQGRSKGCSRSRVGVSAIHRSGASR